ncbi:cytochrome b5-like heme/steroid binding domain-containing protein, partial [Dimargaris cristalligena]
IYMAVNGKVFDVTKGANFYGPEGPYGNFAGHDASRGLAKGSFEKDMLPNVDGPLDTLADLADDEREALRDWEALFTSKYPQVGVLV